ncbi:PA3496 family putative envelope integrity protein [Sulfuriflexus mobilis]|uniref:PA3496 family putative envelope integrity protein n=1 Tax=Sulfuriflexus mobilis TaxID=1811807 RepID=UPI000F84E195|nr:hypothetical protein [Sulfuriflexus mobilis]
MHHRVDMYEAEDEYFDDNYFSESPVKSKAKQKNNYRTRRKLEDRLDAQRLRKLLDDFTDY